MIPVGGSLNYGPYEIRANFVLALVGALSIIQFRMVVKGTKDTACIFLGLAVGMAARTASYFLAIVGTGFSSTIALVLN